MIRHQLSIFVENEPGVLARVAKALADANVNLRALCVSDNVDDAVLRIDDRDVFGVGLGNAPETNYVGVRHDRPPRDRRRIVEQRAHHRRGQPGGWCEGFRR